jgi:hypothetical protein
MLSRPLSTRSFTESVMSHTFMGTPTATHANSHGSHKIEPGPGASGSRKARIRSSPDGGRESHPRALRNQSVFMDEATEPFRASHVPGFGTGCWRRWVFERGRPGLEVDTADGRL